jgi:hypothetical protein
MGELTIRLKLEGVKDLSMFVTSCLHGFIRDLHGKDDDDVRDIGRMLVRGNGGFIHGDALFTFDDDQEMKAVQRRFAWARGVVTSLGANTIYLILTDVCHIEVFPNESPEVLSETLVALLVEGTVSADAVREYAS